MLHKVTGAAFDYRGKALGISNAVTVPKPERMKAGEPNDMSDWLN
jgi:hypothetical protein